MDIAIRVGRGALRALLLAAGLALAAPPASALPGRTAPSPPPAAAGDEVAKKKPRVWIESYEEGLAAA